MTAASSEAVVAAVDIVLSENLEKKAQRIAPFLPKNMPKKQGIATMQSDKLIQCDMNVELWQAALHATLRDINSDTYPHYAAVQHILNYVLSCHKYTDVGLVSLVMSKLRSAHPPGSKVMSEYYSHILEDNYAKISTLQAEDRSFFWVVVDLVIETGKDEIHYEKHPLPDDEPDENVKDTLFLLSGKTKAKSFEFFSDLSLDEKRKRSVMCLQYLCDIVVDDFIYWLEGKGKSRCLLARLLWPDEARDGDVTSQVKKIIGLQQESLTRMGHSTRASEKLLHITAELIRTFDQRKKMQYPFFGSHTQTFAREFSSYVIEHYDESKLMSYLQRVDPPWLRLLTTSQILGHLAGFQCEPDLLSAITVMENLEHIYKIGRAQSRLQQTQDRPPANPELVAKFSKLKSVNASFRTGLSRLQTACFDDNIDAVRALLTFPLLDLNQTDASGWTALHIAARKGSETCVQEMLSYNPPIGSLQRRVDTRARGPSNFTPLMCAVQGNQANICTMLLSHTGSILLDDITDENQTALELCENPEIFTILKGFKDRRLVTIHSVKELHMKTGNLPLVTRLCTTLIQSYFSVHCTWKVYHAIKNFSKAAKPIERTKPISLFEYSRYHRDLKTNLPKIRRMVMKLKKIKDLESPIQILVCIVSLNKA